MYQKFSVNSNNNNTSKPNGNVNKSGSSGNCEKRIFGDYSRQPDAKGVKSPVPGKGKGGKLK